MIGFQNWKNSMNNWSKSKRVSYVDDKPYGVYYNTQITMTTMRGNC
jgi:hypothetical protein